ncbi:hypothetical protein RP20_CCG006260 [Aedes albopictus]|nr:hypothetical protein RP20_CCG006260 [Aedes albopictus]
MDKETNLIQRMGPVKHELYFPQCYGAAFNQPFVTGTAVVTANPPTTVHGNTAGASVPPTTAVNPNAQQTHTTATVTAVPASVAAVITAPPPQQAIVAQ